MGPNGGRIVLTFNSFCSTKNKSCFIINFFSFPQWQSLQIRLDDSALKSSSTCSHVILLLKDKSIQMNKSNQNLPYCVVLFRITNNAAKLWQFGKILCC